MGVMAALGKRLTPQTRKGKDGITCTVPHTLVPSSFIGNESAEVLLQDNTHPGGVSGSGQGSFLGQPIQQGIVGESRYGNGRELMRMTPKTDGASREPLLMRGGLRWNRN
jgi:hypothetical protein